MKKGISLIVLVITIIVMIIIAGSIIISLTNNNAIDNANKAVNDTEFAQAKTMAEIAYAELYAGGTRGDDLKTGIEGRLRDNGFDMNNYKVIITNDKMSFTKANIIKFSVTDDVMDKVYTFNYQCEENMTWEDFLNSNYYADQTKKEDNLVFKLIINDDEIWIEIQRNPVGQSYHMYQDANRTTVVKKTDKIIAQNNYISDESL